MASLVECGHCFSGHNESQLLKQCGLLPGVLHQSADADQTFCVWCERPLTGHGQKLTQTHTNMERRLFICLFIMPYILKHRWNTFLHISQLRKLERVKGLAQGAALELELTRYIRICLLYWAEVLRLKPDKCLYQLGDVTNSTMRRNRLDLSCDLVKKELWSLNHLFNKKYFTTSPLNLIQFRSSYLLVWCFHSSFLCVTFLSLLFLTTAYNHCIG